MKTKLTTAIFAALAFSLLLYSCQKEETIRVATPNKPSTPTTVVINNPDPSKPIDNPTSPTPTSPSPSNPNHPPIDPNVSVSNSASCVNCHRRIVDADFADWNGGFGVSNTHPAVSNGGLTNNESAGHGR